ncbi:mandelate racemase/muconate lactonizing enzyme family protein [Sphingobium nicotianae]|uniref:Mandelate racemase/muconate lactonizing enzyme family protein n=1 Tax=Sphingobium nicotianae TaxID=2782607 RepID=A0A9X1IQT0_9SPHN|nr:mandelate racemase/muconate lactonizing enzyme family protein [Sphingobium nicotianae]MBT2186897.1 mandelate racemase/muconate lactonizing enzyme family protein [Sphingobium nicotianae]
MRITKIELLHADGGWRTISFLKLSTDEGLTGWSEYNETVWNPGLTPVVQAISAAAIGRDPRAFASIAAVLHASLKLTPGGLGCQAVAAVENACIDVAAKAAGVPAYRLLGGPVRARIPVYWSHAGLFRATIPDAFERDAGSPPVRGPEDYKALGAEIRAKGFTALKTNPVIFGGPDGRRGGTMANTGIRATPDLDLAGAGRGYPLAGLIDQLEALRDGAGPDMEIMLDLNFSLRGEGMRRVAGALDHLGLAWMEIDTDVPAALADVRGGLMTPVASLESLHGMAQYRPWLEQRACDVVLIDPMWNGVYSALRIAALADAFGFNVAVHNCYGRLGDRQAAAFAALAPNLRIMEMEPDDVRWHADLVDAPLALEDSALLLDERIGWGCDPDEVAIRAHPPRPDPTRPWLA